MNDHENTFVIYLKVKSIITRIKNYFNITYIEALDMLYRSNLYEVLENEDTKMWYYSSYDLFKMFLEEREKGKYTCTEAKNG